MIPMSSALPLIKRHWLVPVCNCSRAHSSFGHITNWSSLRRIPARHICMSVHLIFAATAQVVIARVISFDHEARRLRLSLALKTGNPEAAGDPAEALQLGDLVEGVVISITSKEVSNMCSAVSPALSPFRLLPVLGSQAAHSYVG